MNEKPCIPSRLFTPPFAAVASAQLFSLLGEAILKFVLPLYLLNLSGSATLYGIVVACAFVPYIFLTPIGGVLADRVNKKLVMAALDLVMAAASIAYLALAQTADLVVLTIVILMVLYAAQSIYQPTVQSSVPSVVSHDRITSATAIVTQISALTGLVGPVFGGLVFGFFGVAPIVAVSAGAFLASSLLIIAFVKIPSARHESSGSPLTILKGDIKEAVSFLKLNPLMWKTILLATVINLVASAFIIVGTPYIVTEVLRLPNQLMGFAEAALALGGLAGGVVISLKPALFPIRKAPRFLFGAALGFIPIAVVTASALAPVAVYGILLVSLSWTMAMCSMFSIIGISFLQMETPSDLVGKVIALTMSAANCAMPAGQLIFGIGFDSVPAPALALGVALVMLGVAAFAAKTFKNELGNLPAALCEKAASEQDEPAHHSTLPNPLA